MNALADSAFALRVRLLTGRYVATVPDDRTRAEWPPHPGRLYMALVAALYETEPTPERREALRWLGGLEAPDVLAASAPERTTAASYVPVNDAHREGGASMPGMPGLYRSRQARHYPTVVPESDRIDFVYSADAASLERHERALAEVAAEVIRIGHSSSLATVELVAAGAVESDAEGLARWTARARGQGGETVSLRVPDASSLDRLDASFGGAYREAFERAKAEVESSKGKTKAAAKERFKALVGSPYRAKLAPPPPAPARIGRTVAYAKLRTPAGVDAVDGPFDPEPYVLTKIEGPALGLASTLLLTEALRGAILAEAPAGAPAWLSGHGADGRPAREAHLALVPLSFVGDRYADGHVLGLGIVVPRGVDADEIGQALGPLMVDVETGEARSLELRLGRLGTWEMALETRAAPPRALRPETWATSRGARRWASVTPVVLDRFPKRDRGIDREGWMQELEYIVRRGCLDSGLPEPVSVSVGTTSSHVGAPRSSIKRRRGRSGEGRDAGALGTGFPAYRPKKRAPPRLQFHVELEFDVPVRGPVLVGAGRFRGYGFLRPVRGDDR